MGRLREEIEDRIETKSVVALAVIAWVSIELFDTAPEQFAATMIASAISGGAGLLADAFDLRDGARYAGLGVASLFGAAVLFAAERSVLVPAALGLIGAWLTLDGVQSLRHGGAKRPAEAELDGEAVYRQYLRRRVRGLLADRPRSRAELGEAMDADPEDVDAALTELRERDLVSLRGGVYHQDAPETPGRLLRIRGWIVGRLRRLARPVTAEFRDEDPYASGDEQEFGRSASSPARSDRSPDATSEAESGSPTRANVGGRGERERVD